MPTETLRAALAVALCAMPLAAGADDTAVASVEDGKYFAADETPTFNVSADGTVDWYTFSGFRRYHSECHVCHGPDGMGSTYAPPLKDAVMNLDYWEFTAVVAAGLEHVDASGNSVMPAFGLNRNVMCYLDDIWVYLRARGADAVPRGRPAKREDKPDAFVEHENACMAG
ncbi:MAG: c-type cytochrome, methanol metabolism-related [Rubrimonas sp.]|uniref:c-type cytochrome, methanol metabolism-related n=1 Tax=Rubrimonas sp. TaxID=2036015 RepID=UPI003DCD34B0